MRYDAVAHDQRWYILYSLSFVTTTAHDSPAANFLLLVLLAHRSMSYVRTAADRFKASTFPSNELSGSRSNIAPGNHQAVTVLSARSASKFTGRQRHHGLIWGPSRKTCLAKGNDSPPRTDYRRYETLTAEDAWSDIIRTWIQFPSPIWRFDTKYTHVLNYEKYPVQTVHTTHVGYSCRVSTRTLKVRWL